LASALRRLLKISAHACDLEVIGNDWNNARSIGARTGFDGFELSLAHTDDAEGIPADIITAVHLKFFPLLDAMWRGDARYLVKTLHLTRSLSGDYAERLHRGPSPLEGVEEFWERFGIAQSHVLRVDQHEPFEDPGFTRLLDWISPDYLVFEFFYSDMAEWQTKIARQKWALDGVDPSRCPLPAVRPA
jgi:hypothetical protein